MPSTSHRRPTDRIRQIMAANAATGMGHSSAHGADSAKQRQYVYVQDESYSWLPARVVSVDLPESALSCEERDNEQDASVEIQSLKLNGGQNEAAARAGATATVTIVLPRDWRDQTVLQEGSGDLEDLELLSEHHYGSSCSRFGDGGGDDSSSVMTGMTGMTGASRRSRMPAERDSSAPRVERTVRLADYPNGQLPLQNVDRRGRLIGKSDMADLPNLHEAAILYNLKERHGRGVPYTRVGDIVVAMNPFRWIDGLYSADKRNFYSEHLIWNSANDENQDQGQDQDQDPNQADAVLVDGQQRGSSRAASTSVDPKTYKSEYDRLGYDPHVYETSCLAYRGLAIDKRNQCILVSGESGAGKTETVKIVMSHLATVERTRPHYHATAREHENAESASSTVRRVLESNPVFEAFGNAKTVRNDNSSRFGKFTRLQFDVEGSSSARAHRREVPACLLAGSICTTYLLEKSRVVGHAPGERNYHIFYQLLAAPEDIKTWIWDGLGGTSPEAFACIGESEIDGIEGRSDAEWWDRTAAALGVFGIAEEELRDMMRALCVVMQLGNLTFDLDPNEEHQDQAIITSEDDLDLLADVMGVPAEDIAQALTVRTMKMRGEEIKSGLTPADAKEGRDALAKDLYARLFDLLVGKMNDYTRAEANYVPSSEGRGGGTASKRNKFQEICLLDIFGFERFETNRFEQMCINYANEKLQHRYAVDIFAETKEEYEAEGIELFDFSKVDNSGVLDLLEGRMGLITSLNEECKRPKGNDAAFVYRIKTMHADSKHLIQKPLDLATEFGIQHFAGAVTYDASNFVERNTDKLPQDLLECACKSTNKTIQREFQQLASSVQDAMAGAPRRGGATTKHTVITTFKKQLTDLMACIEKTKTRYIRCIKPNHHMDPGVTNHTMTMTQLQSAGLVTAIAITRESFPNRLPYDTVMERFKILIPPDEMKRSGTVRERVDFLLMKLCGITARYDMPYALGKTKVYFRAGALERLESIRLEYFSSRAIVIQTWARLIMAGKRYEEMRLAAIAIQARGRAYLEVKSFQQKQRAAITLQCAVRCLFAVWELEWRRENRAVTVIQGRWRMIKHRRYFVEAKYAAYIVQRYYRNKRNQIVLREKLAELLENARMENRLAQLQEQVHVLSPEANADVDMGRDLEEPVNENMMQEVESMFDYLRKEISELRTENEELQTDANAFDEENRELTSNLQAAQAASQLAKTKLSEMEKSNEELHLEVKESKAKVAELKKELKSREEVQAQDVDGMRNDYEKAIADRDAEIRKLKGDLKASKRALRMEREMLTDEVERVQEEHLSEIMRLKNELKKTRDSHHDYLAKLMDVLETTHATREEETAKLNSDLEVLRKEKDAEVTALQEELKQLRLQNEVQVREEMLAREAREKAEIEAAEKNAKEISTLKDQINKHAEDRKDREEKFRNLSEALDDEIALLEKSHQEVSRPHNVRNSGSIDEAPLVFEGPPSKMQKMMWSLKDMYKSEQASHISVEQETLRMSEKLGLAPAADYAGFNKKMAQALKVTRHENQMLKEQLAKLTASSSGHENGISPAIPGASPRDGRDSQMSSERRPTSSRSRTAERASTTSSERRARQQVGSSGRGVSVDRESSRRRLQRVRNSQQTQQTDYSRSMPPQTQGNSQALQHHQKLQISPHERSEPRKERSSINRHPSGTNRISSAALRQSAPPTSALGSSRREKPIARIGRTRTRSGSRDDGHHL